MSADWWSRKLAGNVVPPPPAQPGNGYPAAYTAPSSYPGGPRPAPGLPPVPQGQQPQVTKDNIAEVAGLWQGGQATKTETARCPNCGGDHYFSMRNGASAGGAGARIATERGMANTSPRCFDCGWNDHHGLQTGAGA